jgi:hypothetical protein
VIAGHDLNPDHIAWSKDHFELMAQGGIWAVPRSGLVFTKILDGLVLTAVMPHEPEMPVSEAELHEYQDADYAVIKEHFEAAGVPVSRSSELPNGKEGR